MRLKCKRGEKRENELSAIQGNPKRRKLMAAQGARHPFKKPNTWCPLLELDLATWLEKAEQRCIRAGKIKLLIESNKRRTLRRMETYQLDIAMMDLPEWWAKMEMDLATTCEEPVPNPDLEAEGARHPCTTPNSRSTQLETDELVLTTTYLEMNLDGVAGRRAVANPEIQQCPINNKNSEVQGARHPWRNIEREADKLKKN